MAGPQSCAEVSNTRRTPRRHGLLLLLAALVIAAAAGYNALLSRWVGAQEVHVLGESVWTPGAPASVRVIVLGHDDQRPIAGALVRVLLKPPRGQVEELAAAHTDASGTLNCGFTAPEGEGQAQDERCAAQPTRDGSAHGLGASLIMPHLTSSSRLWMLAGLG
ncbi:MAG: hypothetical protein QHJ73_17520, partial [Armatimonadota bacterium]|nr:hypothetical protein [Armatimonadota bacterium]